MQVEKQLTFGRDARVRLALTLVELLVTVSIMGLIIAVSIPVVRPMLASNKVKSGADMVAGFLAQARNRAIEEGRPVGVTFERVLNYEDNGAYPYNGASVLMRQVAEPKPLSGFVKDVRVAVDTSGSLQGTPIAQSDLSLTCVRNRIFFYTWQGYWKDETSELGYWKKLVKTGDLIQFNSQGPKYEIEWDNDANPTIPYIRVNSMTSLGLPDVALFSLDAQANLAIPQPATFKVFRKPQPGKIAPTMATPVALPEGVVVDLDSSGMGNRLSDAKKKVENYGGSDWTVVRDDFCARDEQDKGSVTIMFSPTGEVDRVYYSSKPPINGSPEDTGIAIPSGPVYLCVGIWERSGFWMQDGSDWYVSNDYLPDEEQFTRNYHDMNNYWVTLFPRTGTTRVNRVANVSSREAPGAITESRYLAKSLHGSESL